MPSNFEKLRSTEVNELLDKLSSFYGCDLNHLKKYYFYSLKRGKIHICTLDLEKFWPDKINTLGLYFGTYHDEERFRLSFEGSRYVEPTKNFIQIKDGSLSSYVSGENLFTEEAEEINWQENCPFLIVRYEGESLGCANVKGDFILNYLSKGRKLDFNKLF